MGQSFCSQHCSSADQDHDPDMQLVDDQYKLYRSSMITLNPIGDKITNIKNFIEGHDLPEKMKVKYIDQLFVLRMEIVEEMLQHTDRYNGYCQLRELMIEYAQTDQLKVHQWLQRSISTSYDSLQSLLMTDDHKKTTCNIGRSHNENMQSLVNVFRTLGYADNNDVIYCAYIIKY